MNIGYKIRYYETPASTKLVEKYFFNVLYAINFLHKATESYLCPVLSTFEYDEVIEQDENN